MEDCPQLETTKARKAQLLHEAQVWSRFTEPLPYSILLADRLREEMQAERLKVTQGESDVVMLAHLVEEQRDALAQAEEKIRQLNEQLEGVSDPAIAARLSWQRDFERLRSQVAASKARATSKRASRISFRLLIAELPFLVSSDMATFPAQIRHEG